MFNTNPVSITKVQTGQTYANCGGKLREARKCRKDLTPEEKALIRKLYMKGSKEFGLDALAKLFNCNRSTIPNVVHSAK